MNCFLGQDSGHSISLTGKQPALKGPYKNVYMAEIFDSEHSVFFYTVGSLFHTYLIGPSLSVVIKRVKYVVFSWQYMYVHMVSTLCVYLPPIGWGDDGLGDDGLI